MGLLVWLLVWVGATGPFVTTVPVAGEPLMTTPLRSFPSAKGTLAPQLISVAFWTWVPTAEVNTASPAQAEVTV